MLMLQREELNRSGELYLNKHPKLQIRIVDGSSLVVAVVIKSIPKGTDQVMLKGKLSKISGAITIALCQMGVKVPSVNLDLIYFTKARSCRFLFYFCIDLSKSLNSLKLSMLTTSIFAAYPM